MPSDIVRATAILGLVLLECVAMLTGHDGQLFLPVAGLIGYIAGLKTDKVVDLLALKKK